MAKSLVSQPHSDLIPQGCCIHCGARLDVSENRPTPEEMQNKAFAGRYCKKCLKSRPTAEPIVEVTAQQKSDLTPQDMQILEAILDRVGNARLVDALSRIASEKAEHVRSNWQDKNLARVWVRISNRYDNLVSPFELCDDVLGFRRESEGR